MQVIFLSKFSKDLDRIKSRKLKASVLEIIESIEEAKELKGFPNIKKLKGHGTSYRIRIGEYRLGFYLEKNVVILARLVHRKDIYRLFP